jgi:hypothetical protein
MRARGNLRDIGVDRRTVVNIQFPTFQRNMLVLETPGTNFPETWHHVFFRMESSCIISYVR